MPRDPEPSAGVRRASLYEPLAEDAVRCGLCRRACRIPPGERGACRTRANMGGQLYTLVYGQLAALESRPIEIKPFFHFHPGSSALTYCCFSCNLACRWCQNWHLSRSRPGDLESRLRPASYVSPEKLVAMAQRQGDKGLCASFTEPTLLHEYNLDAFPLARAAGLYTCYVSNGYLTTAALRELREAGLDAIKIDVKGPPQVYRTNCGVEDGEGVWVSARTAREMGLHVEIVHLVIPGVNDDAASLDWLLARHLENVGPDTPLHFTRYFPAYQMSAPATPISTLEAAYARAKEAGIRYPYLGNVPGHRYENTYCPDCGELLIERYGYTIVNDRLHGDYHCPHCGRTITVVYN